MIAHPRFRAIEDEEEIFSTLHLEVLLEESGASVRHVQNQIMGKDLGN